MVLASLLCFAGGIWYRAVEIPDVGEPFDVEEFLAGIPPLDKNEAGLLIRRALANVERYREKVDLKEPALPFTGGFAAGSSTGGNRSYLYVALQVPERGWPKEDARLSRWLDLIFDGEWYRELYRAARLPLGVITSPRQMGDTGESEVMQRGYEIKALLAARAMQFRNKKDLPAALEQIETLLGLSRQLKNHARWDGFYVGASTENEALRSYDGWLRDAYSRPELLRSGLRLLQEHEARSPNPLDAIKAEYFAFVKVIDKTESSLPLNTQTTNVLQRELGPPPHAPWEHERAYRLGRALYQAVIQQAARPYWTILAERSKQERPADPSVALASACGLPAATGPASEVSAHQWGRWLSEGWFVFFPFPHIRPPIELTRLRGEMLLTALTLYQAENGKPAAKLEDLVPRYLAAPPVDPFSGQSFKYRISSGEQLAGQTMDNNQDKLHLRPGQGLVWSDGAESFGPADSRPERRFLFAVPVAAERKRAGG